MKEIPISTPIGEMMVSKDWIIKELTKKDNNIKLISDTYFISNQQTWSINKKDYDSILPEIRNNKINTILN